MLTFYRVQARKLKWNDSHYRPSFLQAVQLIFSFSVLIFKLRKPGVALESRLFDIFVFAEMEFVKSVSPDVS